MNRTLKHDSSDVTNEQRFLNELVKHLLGSLLDIDCCAFLRSIRISDDFATEKFIRTNKKIIMSFSLEHVRN